MSAPEMHTVSVPVFWAPSPWRHPIEWWRTRHLRAHMREAQRVHAEALALLSPEGRALVERAERDIERKLLGL